MLSRFNYSYDPYFDRSVTIWSSLFKKCQCVNCIQTLKKRLQSSSFSVQKNTNTVNGVLRVNM